MTKSQIDEATVKRIAHLARVKVSSQEAHSLQRNSRRLNLQSRTHSSLRQMRRDFPRGVVECIRKSAKRFSDKMHDKTKT
jgi:hypothetical protein